MTLVFCRGYLNVCIHPISLHMIKKKLFVAVCGQVWDVPSEPGMEEWFKGELNGVVGWFPKAYAEPEPEPAVPSIFSSHADSSDVFG